MDLRTTDQRLAFNPAKHYLGVLCINGHSAVENPLCSWRNKGHGNCVTCTRERARSWRAENPGRSKASTKRRDDGRDKGARRAIWPFATYISGVRNRAYSRGLEFDLSVDELKLLWLKQGGRCYWTDKELSFGVGEARHPFRPSLDRLDPNQGYTIGNVVWSSNFANRARGELSQKDFAVIMNDFGFSGAFSKG